MRPKRQEVALSRRGRLSGVRACVEAAQKDVQGPSGSSHEGVSAVRRQEHDV